MNKSAKTIALSVALLLATNALFGQVYVRPVTLPVGEKTKKISIVEYVDGTRKVLEMDGFSSSKSAAKDTSYFLILDGMWMETIAKSNGDMRLGETVLPFDGVLFDKVLVSNSNNRNDLTNNHERLNASAKLVTTKFMYKDTLGIDESLLNSILRVENHLAIRCGKEGDPGFRVIVNNIDLLPETYTAGTDIELTSEQLEKFGLPDFDKINTVTVIPDGHIPTVIKNIQHETVESRSVIPDIKHKSPWLWIILGSVLALLAAGAGVWMWLRNKKSKEKGGEPTKLMGEKKEDEEENEEEKEEKEEEDEKKEDEKGDDGNEETEEEKEGENEDDDNSVDKLIAKAVEVERKKSEGEINHLKEEKKGLEDKVKELKDDLLALRADVEKRLETARDEVRQKKEKEIDRLKEDKQELESKISGLKDTLRKEKDDAEKRIASAREEVRQKKEKEINNLIEDKKKLNETLNQEREDAKKKIADAHKEEKDIAEKAILALTASHQAEVKRLEDEQKVYTDKIAFVPFATQYAKDIYSLIGTVNDINRQARELTKVDVEDPYLIFKAISKFNLAQSEIDYEGLLLDVSLAAKNDMSFTNSGVTNLKTVSQDQMFSSLRSYFLSAYLEKYINAAVVYNESLAGIDRLVDGIDASMTAPFKQYREKIKECCKRLGIAVISVKLFDTLGDNMDLKATMVDFDDSLPADSIIAIENCLVYPEGGRRPMEKIYVKAQK